MANNQLLYEAIAPLKERGIEVSLGWVGDEPEALEKTKRQIAAVGLLTVVPPSYGHFIVEAEGWYFTAEWAVEREAYFKELAQILGGECYLDGKSAVLYCVVTNADPAVIKSRRYLPLFREEESTAVAIFSAVSEKVAEVTASVLGAVKARDEIKINFVSLLEEKPPPPEVLEILVDNEDGCFMGGEVEDSLSCKRFFGGWVRRGDSPRGPAPGRQKVTCRHPRPEEPYCRSNRFRAFFTESTYYIDTPESAEWLEGLVELAQLYKESHKAIWEALDKAFPSGEKYLVRGYMKMVAARLGPLSQAFSDWGREKVWWPDEWYYNNQAWKATCANQYLSEEGPR